MVCSTGGRASVEGSQLSVVGEYRQMRQKDCSGGRRVSGGDVVWWKERKWLVVRKQK
jgi:hypothetical protein